MKSSVLILLLFLASSQLLFSFDNLDFELSLRTASIRNLSAQKIDVKSNRIQVEFNRPKMQMEFESELGNFLIHYDTSGINAVSSVDINKNGVSDYIDSVAYYLEYIFEIEINELGYLSPIPDSGAGGSDAYDIYVLETGIGDLWDTFYGLTVNDIEIYPKRIFDRYTAFTIIDNNYSELDSTKINDSLTVKTFKTTGIEALKITLAHEFHHAIQFITGIPEPDIPFIYEMTSLAIENNLFPESKDYLQFVNDLLRNYPEYSFSDPTLDLGYRYGIFLIYLTRKYDISLIKSIWDEIYNGYNPFEAIELALERYSTNFDNEFCSFWNDFIIAAVDNKSEYFIDADLFIKPIFTLKREFYENAVIESIMLPYTVNIVSLISNKSANENDTIRIMISHEDFDGLLNLETNEIKYTLIVSNEFDEASIRIGNSSYYYYLTNHDFFCVNTFLDYKETLEEIDFAFPSPFNLLRDEIIYFTVSNNYIENQIVKLTVYDVNFKIQFQRNLSCFIRNNKKVVSLDEMHGLLQPGTYLFSTGDKENMLIGKFVVLK